MFSAKQPTNKMRIGALGEEAAVNYLLKNGIRIIDRNHRNYLGEIDIIGIDSKKILVFFEVKTIFNNGSPDGLSPEDNFSRSKKEKLVRSCEMFVAKHPNLVTDMGWRIDLIALTINNKDVNIKIYENV